MTREEAKKDYGPLGNLRLLTEQMSHYAVVISSATVLDQQLERAIKAKMPNYSPRLEKNLFGDRGPLNTFAAKIDMAHALDITSGSIHAELQKIRRMRNKFAHSDDFVSLDEGPMRSLFYALRRPPGVTGTCAQQFLACIKVISEFLDVYCARMTNTGSVTPAAPIVSQGRDGAAL